MSKSKKKQKPSNPYLKVTKVDIVFKDHPKPVRIVPVEVGHFSKQEKDKLDSQHKQQ